MFACGSAYPSDLVSVCAHTCAFASLPFCFVWLLDTHAHSHFHVVCSWVFRASPPLVGWGLRSCLSALFLCWGWWPAHCLWFCQRIVVMVSCLCLILCCSWCCMDAFTFEQVGIFVYAGLLRIIKYAPHVYEPRQNKTCLPRYSRCLVWAQRRAL